MTCSIVQLVSALAMIVSSVFACRAWLRMNKAAERYTRALTAMQDDAAKGRFGVTCVHSVLAHECALCASKGPQS